MSPALKFKRRVRNAGLAASREQHACLAIATAFLLVLSGAAARAADIVVTIAGPATGAQAVRAKAMLAGAQQAAAAANAGGGIKGATLRVDFADDGCDPVKSEALARELALKKTDLVLGHPCARAESAAKRVYAETGTIFIGSASRHTSGARPANAKTIFRIAGRDELQGVEAAEFLAAYKSGAIAIVHDRTRAQRDIADAAASALTRLGASMNITATLIGGDKDFPLLTAKIQSAAAVFFAGFPIEAGILYAQLRQAGANPVFLMSETNGTAELTDTFGEGIGGAYIMSPRFGLTGAANRDPNTDTRIAEADAALADAAVTAFAAAANRADSVNPEIIARELSARGTSTAHGNVMFDKNGEAVRPSYDVYKWTGKFWERANSGPLSP